MNLLTFDELRQEVKKFGNPYLAREPFLSRSIYGLPCKETIDELENFINGKTCLEVMGSPGFLSYCLQERGVDITCTDLNPGEHYSREIFGNNGVTEYCEIEKMDAAEAIRTYTDASVVIMCWPPHKDRAGYDALKEMRPLQFLVHIGEGMYGCTGDYAMHWAIKNNFTRDRLVEIPWYSFCSDYVSVYRRNLKPWQHAKESYFNVYSPKEDDDEV